MLGLVCAHGAVAVLVVVISSASARVTSPGDGEGTAAKRETHLVCLNGDGTEYRRKEQPKQCAILGQGGIFAGGVNLEKLRWRDWGHKRAEATGIECGFHLPCENIKAKVRAWRPRERCGKRVYTRLEATTHFGHSRADVQGCPGPAFKAVVTPSHKPSASETSPPSRPILTTS